MGLPAVSCSLPCDGRNFCGSFVFVAVLLVHEAVELGDRSRDPFSAIVWILGFVVIEPGRRRCARQSACSVMMFQNNLRDDAANFFAPPGPALQPWKLNSAQVSRGQHPLPWLEGRAVGRFAFTVLELGLDQKFCQRSSEAVHLFIQCGCRSCDSVSRFELERNGQLEPRDVFPVRLAFEAASRLQRCP